MAKKSEIEQRRNQLLTELERHPEGLSYKALEALLQKKKRTIASDVEELRNSGSQIIIRKDKLYLQSKGSVVAHSSKQTARRLALLMQADKGALKAQDKLLRDNTLAPLKGQDIQFPKKRIDNRDKTKASDLQSLCDTGMLLKEKELFQLGWNAPKNVYFKDYELEIIYRTIKENSEGYAYQNTLNEIAEQIQDAMQFKLLYDEFKIDNSNITIGKKETSNTVFANMLSQFGTVDFRNNILLIDYKLADAQTIQRKIATGMIVYSVDHAKIYLIGKEFLADGRNENTILDLQKIESVVKTDEMHSFYLSAEFSEIYDEMYSVSVEPHYDVEVLFDDVFNIREKIERLGKNRKYASVTIEEGNIVYRDRIRGLNDFAKYLRGFGMSCKVTKPNELVEKMYQSACRIYDLYPEEEADQRVFYDK